MRSRICGAGCCNSTAGAGDAEAAASPSRRSRAGAQLIGRARPRSSPAIAGQWSGSRLAKPRRPIGLRDRGSARPAAASARPARPAVALLRGRVVMAGGLVCASCATLAARTPPDAYVVAAPGLAARVRQPARPAGRSAAARLLAWYDRHRRALPWRALPGERARSLPRLAQRDHAAADHGRRGRARTSTLPGALADGRARSPRAARRRAGAPGRASATTRAPATCTPAPQVVAGGTAGASPTPRRRCARCPASATTPRPPSPRSPSTGRRPSVDGNVERVVARLFAVETPLPDGQAGAASAGRGADAAASGRATSRRR